MQQQQHHWPNNRMMTKSKHKTLLTRFVPVSHILFAVCDSDEVMRVPID